METIYECKDKGCLNRDQHFHSNQCYVGCYSCYPPYNKPKHKIDPVEVSLLVALSCALIGFILSTINLVGVLTQPDGTYQKCRIPAPNTSQGFYCDPIEREEYLPHVSNDLVDNPDGSQTWYVSHER